ncbi:hypothetical protein [Streptomyces sp. 6N106]|uniref:hypothetical protein n=1 Tax=Streptomyces sp. 6N106 TaxID=3457418 RepID=UPI003FD3705A
MRLVHALTNRTQASGVTGGCDLPELARTHRRRQYRPGVRYVYRCEPCQAAAPERSDEYQARADRHRAIAHHGLIPADRIDEIPGPLAVLGQSLRRSALAALVEGSRQVGKSKTVREVRASEYWR